MSDLKLTSSQQKALHYQHHVALTANAGSGKTKVLTERFIEIILKEDISVKNIAAITFTKKAASELYQKLCSELDKRYLVAKDRDIRRKLQIARREMISAYVSTFHSFCGNILKKFPVEAGIDANYTMIDSAEAGELVDISINSVFRILQSQVDTPEKIALDKLTRLFGGTYFLMSAVKKMVGKRKIVSEVIENLYSSKNTGELIQYYEKEFVRTQLFFPSPSKKNNDKNEGKETLPEDSLSVHSRLVEYSRFLITLFTLVNEHYAKSKLERSCLDFEDIILSAYSLLTSKEATISEEIREELSAEFKYIMIDEYQDTDMVQYELFKAILKELNSGNLFIVGDEKQSIYGWRNAEVEVFRETKRQIEEKSEESRILTLSESFRMVPALAAFTNHFCREMFKNANFEFNEIDYEDLVCGKKDDKNYIIEMLQVSKSALDGDEETSDDSSILEGRMTAQRIIKLIDEMKSEEGKPIDFKDIAILCRKRGSFAGLEVAFTEYGIPFNIVGGRGFYNRQFIFDIISYFSFLINQDDDISLASILRSPFFTLSDTHLYKISNMEGISFWEKLNAYSLDNPKINSIVEILRRNAGDVISTGIIEMLRRFTLETPFLSVLASGKEGKQNLANFDKLVTISEEFIAKGFKGVFDYVEFLKNAVENIDDESQADISSDDNTVKILTIHQSKGLQYKAVFIFDANSEQNRSNVKKGEIYIDKKLGLLFKIPQPENHYSKYLTPKILETYENFESRKTEAEFKRLIYVAITRAENYLFFVFSSQTDKKTGEAKIKTGSILKLLYSALQVNLTNAGTRSFTVPLKLYTPDSSDSQTEIMFDYKITTMNYPLDVEKLEETNFEKYNSIKFNINIDAIESTPSGEIISASKFADYTACPMKYQLKNVFDFSELWDKQKLFSPKEEGSPESLIEYRIDMKFSDIPDNHRGATRGTIVHKILEKDVPLDKLDEFIAAALCNTEEILSENQKDELAKDIRQTIKKFYNSETYEFIKSFEQQYNEYELFVASGDYFLTGKLDKLVIDKKNILIFDYKSDKITKEKISERALKYRSQLTFYAYLISQKFKDIEEISINIIFIQYPNEVNKYTVTRSELDAVKESLDKMLGNLRKGIFLQNKEHCNECTFALAQKVCVIDN